MANPLYHWPPSVAIFHFQPKNATPLPATAPALQSITNPNTYTPTPQSSTIPNPPKRREVFERPW